jgi:hypothetical protein
MVGGKRNSYVELENISKSKDECKIVEVFIVVILASTSTKIDEGPENIVLEKISKKSKNNDKH